MEVVGIHSKEGNTKLSGRTTKIIMLLTVFTEHGEWLDSVIPMLVHGDEGRGVRKGNTAVVTLEPALGLDSCTSDTYHGCECCAPSTKPVSLCEKQNVNMQYHSYLTKFLLFCLPNKVYKETEALQQLMTGVSRTTFSFLRRS